MRTTRMLAVGLTSASLVAGGIVFAGNAMASDNTSIRVYNQRKYDGGKDITFCAETKSGSTRCFPEIGIGHSGTVGIEIQAHEQIEIYLTKGPDSHVFLDSDDNPGSQDIDCYVTDKNMACHWVGKR